MNQQEQQANPIEPPPAGTADAAGEQALSFLSSIEKQVAELRRMSGETARRAQALDAREAELHQRAAESERRLAEARADAERAASEAAGHRARVEQAEQRASQLSEQVERAIEQLAQARAALEHAERTARDAAEQAETVRRERTAFEDSLNEQLSGARAEIQSLRAAAEAAAHRAADVQAAAEQATGRREQLESESARLGEQVGALQKQVESLSAEATEAAGDRDVLDSMVQDLTRQLAEARQAQNQARQHDEAGAKELAQAHEALAQREESLRVLAARLLNAEERLIEAERARTAAADQAGELSRQAEALRTAPRARSDEFAVVRRERLARYKDLLSQQSRKIVQAKGALVKKQEQAEETIALRGRLTEQLQVLAVERQRVQAQSARANAAVLLLCLTGVIAIVGGLAWAVANQIAPATYAARAVITADTPGRQPTRDELLAWTASHERILEDPEFMALAAERFGQRGMASMGSPAAVKQRLATDISLHTDKAGTLTIEWRGRGSEKCERELETVALALVAMANSQRDARGDGAATSLSEPPKVGAEPIEDPRLIYVAEFGGGGSIIAGAMFMGLYRIVIRSKRKFEQQMLQIENE